MTNTQEEWNQLFDGVDIPFRTGWVGKRGFVGCIKDDGTLDPKRLKEYYAENHRVDEAWWRSELRFLENLASIFKRRAKPGKESTERG